MRELTNIEEFALIQQFINIESDTYGSSRVVYPILFEGKQAVIKIFVDEGGAAQTELELKRYDEHPEWFAEIYAYGKYCIICEQLVVDYSLIDAIEGGQTYEDFLPDSVRKINITESQYRDAFQLVEDFQDEYGQSCDDSQVGMTSSGRIVLFDYGYDTDAEHQRQVGLTRILIEDCDVNVPAIAHRLLTQDDIDYITNKPKELNLYAGIIYGVEENYEE